MYWIVDERSSHCYLLLPLVVEYSTLQKECEIMFLLLLKMNRTFCFVKFENVFHVKMSTIVKLGFQSQWAVSMKIQM